MSAATAAPPTSSSECGERRRHQRGISGSSARQHAQPVALAERDQAHAGRDEVGREGLCEGLRRLGERQAVRGRAGADGDRIGDLAPVAPPALSSSGLRPGRHAWRRETPCPAPASPAAARPTARRPQPAPRRHRARARLAGGQRAPGLGQEDRRRCGRRRAPARPRSSRRASAASFTWPASTTHSSPCE